MSGFRANSIVNRDGTGAPNFPNGIVATGATFTGGYPASTEHFLAI